MFTRYAAQDYEHKAHDLLEAGLIDYETYRRIFDSINAGLASQPGTIPSAFPYRR